MLIQTKTLLWRLLALLALGLGIIGAFLPIMPTVPFVLVAAWAGGKGWPELEAYLLAHPTFGKPIRNWRERGAVSLKAKILATAMVSVSVTMLWVSPIPLLGQSIVTGLMVCVMLWLWTRPNA